MANHHHYGHICDVCRPERAAHPVSILSGPVLGRRSFFKLAGAGVTGAFITPLFQTEAKAAAQLHLKNTARNCIFILLTGAPSSVDTFDLKVGAWTPSDFNPTTYNGINFPQGLMPRLAEKLTTRLAIVRNLTAPALVHPLQQTWTQIARSPSSALGKIAPNMGSVVSMEFEPQRQANQKLPVFVSLNTGGSVVGAGYFNGLHAPFDVTAAPTGLGNLANADGQTTFEARYNILKAIDGKLRTNSPLGDDVNTLASFYERSKSMMYNPDVDAVFKFTADEQQRYGGYTFNGTTAASNAFGNSLIVARNLIKSNQGTRYVQVNFGSWDHHDDIYDTTDIGRLHGMSLRLDIGLSALIDDLAATPGLKGGTLLDETLIVAMGEFGRTVGSPTAQAGRDHFYQHFAVFAGGGVQGGKVIGTTTGTGGSVLEPGWSQNRPAQYEDIAATIYSALGINYMTTRNDDPFGRGFEYVPFASQGAWYPILELFPTDRVSNSAPPTRTTGRRGETGRIGQ
ncbi:MAG TPA: DUF1501 domain-containing protein [Blastocatellia bacterium]|nr:DUF1501 domain-containing protein [Blastocatellia bacterium]